MSQPGISITLLRALALASVLGNVQQIAVAFEERNETSLQPRARGRTDSSAQWKAHPEKGWVRADDDPEIRKGGKKESDRRNSKRQDNGSKKR
jgi:hypothetical protein